MTPEPGLVTRTWLLARESRRGGTRKWSSFPPLTSSRNSTTVVLLMGATIYCSVPRVILQLGSPTCASRSNVALQLHRVPIPNTTQGPILSKESPQLPKRCAFLSKKLHRSIPLLQLRQDQECDRRDTYEPILPPGPPKMATTTPTKFVWRFSRLPKVP